MLQKTEIAETPSTEVRATAIDKVLPGNTSATQDLDTELAELTACIEAGATRRKSKLATDMKTIKKRGLAYFAPIAIVLLGNLFAMRQGLISPTIANCVTIVSLIAWLPTLKYQSRWRADALPAPPEQERLAAQRLAEIDDVRAVPLIFDALGSSDDKTLATQLWKALGRLLPRLTLEQARALGPERHGRMALWLNGWDMYPDHSHNAEIGTQPVLGTLHVLAQLGQRSLPTYHPVLKTDVAVLDILGTWAAGQNRGKDPELQRAAAAAYEAIQDRMALAKSSAQLLRASDATAPNPEILLRPAQGAQQTDPQELLRATPTNTREDDSA